VTHYNQIPKLREDKLIERAGKYFNSYSNTIAILLILVLDNTQTPWNSRKLKPPKESPAHLSSKRAKHVRDEAMDLGRSGNKLYPGQHWKDQAKTPQKHEAYLHRFDDAYLLKFVWLGNEVIYKAANHYVDDLIANGSDS